tara:strand:+ start:12712 stop:13461 length:750 start_codon:yes stop_codon:yes gene_type:complete
MEVFRNESETLELLRDDTQYYGTFGKQYMSNSDIGSLLTNPKMYGVSQPDNQAFAKGRYFHQLILEPKKAEQVQFVDVSSRNTKLYKEFIAENNMEFALLTKEGDELRRLNRIMMSNLDMYDLIRHPDNVYEVPAIREIKGKMWKGKADIVHPDMIIDIKTTSKIQDFKWSARKYNYDSQCYIYQQLFGKPLIFLVIDKTNRMMGIYRPTDEFVKGGEHKVEKAIEVYEKFYGENATDNIESFYYDEFL